MRRAIFACFAVVAVVGLLSQSFAEDRIGPFKHAQRSVRSRTVDQIHVRVDLKIDVPNQSFTGKATHDVKTFEPLKSIQFDAVDMKVSAVRRIIGKQALPLKFRQSKTTLTVDLNEETAADEMLQIEIDYAVTKPKHGLHFVEPDPGEPNGHTMFWTQSEPEYARYWVPCIDSPTDRLTSEIIATVPADWFVLSNGVFVDKQPAGKQMTWHWKQRKTHVPYLMSVVAGDFEVYKQVWGDVPVLSYVPRGRLAQAAQSFETTPLMMDFFSKKIGVKYPWPKYAQICVDEYNWGGMEHTSASTLNLNTLHDERAELDSTSENLVAHELAHQWFGDLMTCKDWGELWLNESFATYFATLWVEHHRGWQEATWNRLNEEKSYKGEDKRYRRSIVNYRYDKPSNMFDRHSYPKGGRVLHMLRYELGDELFWKSIRRYTEVNQYRTVETADLRTAVEDATGRGMNWFFDQWVYQGGHPEFDVTWRWDEANNSVTVRVKQTQKIDDTTPLFRTSLEFEFGDKTAVTKKRVMISQLDQSFTFELKKRPLWVGVDPENWVLKEATVDQSKQEWLDQLRYSPSMPSRNAAVLALKDFLADEDVVAQLLQTTAGDEFWGVRKTAAELLTDAKGDAVRATLIKAATSDEKAFVRRAAVESLAKFSHDQSKAALRRVIADDPSYRTVAAALNTLVKIDRKNVKDDLLKALKRDSHNNALLQAGINGLAEIKSQAGAETLVSLLATPLEPSRRVAILRGLAKLKPQTSTVVEAAANSLGNRRQPVREAAIAAIEANGSADDEEILVAAKKAETKEALNKQYDKAITEVRKRNSAGSIADRLDAAKRANEELQKRLKQIEAALPNATP